MSTRGAPRAWIVVSWQPERRLGDLLLAGSGWWHLDDPHSSINVKVRHGSCNLALLPSSLLSFHLSTNGYWHPGAIRHPPTSFCLEQCLAETGHPRALSPFPAPVLCIAQQAMAGSATNNATAAQSYKQLKEDFVSNLSGGSVTEIAQVCAVAPV